MDNVTKLEPKDGYKYSLEQDVMDSVMDCLDQYSGKMSNVAVIGVLELIKANYMFGEE